MKPRSKTNKDSTTLPRIHEKKSKTLIQTTAKTQLFHMIDLKLEIESPIKKMPKGTFSSMMDLENDKHPGSDSSDVTMLIVDFHNKINSKTGAFDFNPAFDLLYGRQYDESCKKREV